MVERERERERERGRERDIEIIDERATYNDRAGHVADSIGERERVIREIMIM